MHTTKLTQSLSAAQTLKTAAINTLEEWDDTYVKIIGILRKMYQDCKLVHADFSEYNVLMTEGQIYVIDVSQAVEHDHPMALEFLRRDCGNVNTFFSSRGVSTLSLKQIFYTIVETSVPFSKEYVHKLVEERKTCPEADRKLDDDLFKNLYIPRNLFEIDEEKLLNAEPDQLV